MIYTLGLLPIRFAAYRTAYKSVICENQQT